MYNTNLNRKWWNILLSQRSFHVVVNLLGDPKRRNYQISSARVGLFRGTAQTVTVRHTLARSALRAAKHTHCHRTPPPVGLSVYLDFKSMGRNRLGLTRKWRDSDHHGLNALHRWISLPLQQPDLYQTIRSSTMRYPIRFDMAKYLDIGIGFNYRNSTTDETKTSAPSTVTACDSVA